MPVFAALIHDVDSVKESLIAEPAVIVVVEPSRTILLREDHPLEPNVEVGRREMHLSNGCCSVLRLLQPAGESWYSGRERAVIAPSKMLVNVLSGEQ